MECDGMRAAVAPDSGDMEEGGREELPGFLGSQPWADQLVGQGPGKEGVRTQAEG